MSDKIVVPHFATESEEADWWYANREAHDVIMARAIEDGRAMTMREFLEKRGLQGPRVAISLEFDDVVRAREQANARGVDADAYLRDLVHQAVLKNDAA